MVFVFAAEELGLRYLRAYWGRRDLDAPDDLRACRIIEIDGGDHVSRRPVSRQRLSKRRAKCFVDRRVPRAAGLPRAMELTRGS